MIPACKTKDGHLHAGAGSGTRMPPAAVYVTFISILPRWILCTSREAAFTGRKDASRAEAITGLIK